MSADAKAAQPFTEEAKMLALKYMNLFLSFHEKLAQFERALAINHEAAPQLAIEVDTMRVELLELHPIVYELAKKEVEILIAAKQGGN